MDDVDHDNFLSWVLDHSFREPRGLGTTSAGSRFSYSVSRAAWVDQNGRGSRPSRMSTRMSRWACHPPETPSMWLREEKRRWTRTRRTELPRAVTPWDTSEPSLHVWLRNRGGSHRRMCPLMRASG